MVKKCLFRKMSFLYFIYCCIVIDWFLKLFVDYMEYDYDSINNKG